MIDKLYPCKICGKMVKIRSKGMCEYHRAIELQKIKKSKISKQSDKNKSKSERLKYFFAYHLNEIKKKPYCENCNVKLRCVVSNIAHILPKRKSYNPEVMDNLNNYMYLCSSFSGEGVCHDRYDSIQGSQEVYEMECWSVAVKRYLTFRYNISYNSYVKMFEEYLKNN